MEMKKCEIFEFKSNVTFPLTQNVITELDKIASDESVASNKRVSRAEIGRRAIDEYIVREKNKGDVNN